MIRSGSMALAGVLFLVEWCVATGATQLRIDAPRSPAATPGPTYTPGHFDSDGLIFDYPKDWSRVEQPLYGSREAVAGTVVYVGTGGCATTTSCYVGPGEIEVAVRVPRASFIAGPIDPGDLGALREGESYVTVDGLPAIYEEQAQTAGRTTLTWAISKPGTMDLFAIQATMRDEDAGSL